MENLTKEQQEALEAIGKFNDELYQKHCVEEDGCDSQPILSLTLADYMFFINLSIPSEYDIPEIHIFNSEDDDRIYFEGEDRYESFYEYIGRKFKVIKREINNVEL